MSNNVHTAYFRQTVVTEDDITPGQAIIAGMAGGHIRYDMGMHRYRCGFGIVLPMQLLKPLTVTVEHTRDLTLSVCLNTTT